MLRRACRFAAPVAQAGAVRSDEALQRARCRMRHPHALAFALNVDCRVQWVLRNPRRFQESSNELSSLAAEHGLAYVQVQGTVYRGCAVALAGWFEDAGLSARRGGAGVRETGAVWLLPFDRGALALA